MPKLIRPRTLPVPTRELSAGSWKILRDIDAILLDPDRRQALPYWRIRRKLNKVPRAERGVDWTERVIALYCVKDRKERRSAVLKIKIMNARKEAGQIAEWEEFADRLRATIAPRVLTNHGLMTPFAMRDQDEIATDLTELFGLLETLGYEAFINSGTLLGAVREGRFLGHDDDADLAVLIAGDSDDAMVEALHTLCNKLNQSGKLLQPAWFHKAGPIIKVLVGSGIEVDLFPLWIRDGRAYIWPHTFGDLSQSDIFPLGRQSLCGVDLPAPKDPEKMLELNYGPGWRHPDPNFFFPWSDAKKKFATVLSAYKKRTANHSKLKALLAKLGLKRI